MQKDYTPTERILLIGGLAILLVGMIYGSFYGAFIFQGMVKNRTENMKTALSYAAGGQAEKAEQFYEKVKKADELKEALNGSHSHLSLFGLIALALAGNIRNVRLKEGWKVASAVALLAGGIMLPAGVVMGPFINKTAGKIISITGGIGAIAGIAVYLWGTIRRK